MSDYIPNVDEIFCAAIELPSPEERGEYVDRACGGNAELRHRVDALLAAHFGAGDFLERSPATALLPDHENVQESPGTLIGPYKLLEQIGEGGMGVVYMADQQAPVRRRVALKVIKTGMDTRQVIARFEAERQALALMDHSNIARVLDAGATESGRPYFVMELVRGIPITEYCDQNNLPVHERLELFVQVCHAVQHAHQKGIIHRDLKPSNVMVTLNDGRAVPKVIDFGVAKATGQQLTEKTLFTAFAQMVGTPLYMSPEQAEMTSVDIDTRSDIYSLGVLLYELLTGTTPFDQNRMRSAAFDEIRRIIREEEPPKPSTRISTLGETRTATAAHRQVDSRRLGQLVEGDLDWIVMKALEKDRARRYDTASDFAADVLRHLNDKPVEACPPSAAYRFRKFTRRNKATLAIATAAVTAVLVAVGGIGWAVRDRSARQAKLNDGVEIALQEAARSRDAALARTDNPSEWRAGLSAALSTLKGAEEYAAQDPAAIDLAVADQLQKLRTTLDGDETDRRFVARLDEILSAVIVWDANRNRTKHPETLRELQNAFKSNYGWDVGATPIVEIVRLVQERPEAIQRHLLVAFDVALARAPRAQPQTRQWFADVLGRIDADPWRKQARNALAESNWAALAELLREVDVSQHRPALLYMLSSYLPEQAMDTKTALYRRIQSAYPGELWAHGRFTIALSHHFLAWTMTVLNEYNEEWGLELAQAAVRLVPDDGDFWSVLGMVYYRVGNWKDAIFAIEKAVALSGGGDGEDWFFLAMAHWQLGSKEEARKWYDKAVKWMNANDPQNDELLRFRAEAAALLGTDESFRFNMLFGVAAEILDRKATEVRDVVAWMDKNQPNDPKLRQFRTKAAELLGISEPAKSTDPAPQP